MGVGADNRNGPVNSFIVVRGCHQCQNQKKENCNSSKKPLIFERNNGFQEAELDTRLVVLVVTDYFVGGRSINSRQVLLKQCKVHLCNFFFRIQTAACTIINVNSNHGIMMSDVLGKAAVSVMEFII